MGGGFGQTICLVDVNGDGNDEIVVAAPNWFYDDISRNQVIHDVGKVYVYYGNSDSSKVWKITNILKYIFFSVVICIVRHKLSHKKYKTFLDFQTLGIVLELR